MNKLLKTMLVSAVMVTSGMAATSTENTLGNGATLNVDGTVVLNTDIPNVNGKLLINGGTFTNNAIMKYAPEGSLVITDVFAPGSLKGNVISIYNNGTTDVANLTLNNFNRLNNNYWKFVTSDNKEYPQTGDWSKTSGVSISGGWFTNVQPLTAEVYNQATENATDIKNLSGCDITIDWTEISEATSSLKKGTFTQIGTARTADTSTYASCNPTQGVLDLTNAEGDSSKFSGPISGGTVKLSHKTTADLTGLSATGIIGVYEYDGSNDKLKTVIQSQYIVPAETVADPETIKTEFTKKFKGDVDLKEGEGNFYAFGDGDATDERKTFEGLLADTTLNVSGNKLATTAITTTNESAIKGVTTDDVRKVLVVESMTADQTKEINLNFEGGDPLLFSVGGLVTGTKVQFKGDNSEYTGTAAFGEKIGQVIANGTSSLPVKLGADMTKTDLIIESGENRIDNTEAVDGVTVKSLTMKQDTTLTVAFGTTLNIGSSE